MTPDQHTNQELFLETGDGHRLYVHDWGNKQAQAATPIFRLHGGPGSGTSDSAKQSFDPLRQRVIFYDQRGCGRSTPYGSRKNNTTAQLVADITLIADRLGIERFILTGTSWGSTLALAYALDQPQRVTALVIGGIFTASQQEIDWLDNGGCKLFYPDAWQRYLQATPEEHRHNPSAYHHKRAQAADEEAAKRSTYAYACLEADVMSLDDRHTPPDFESFDPVSGQLEMYYMANRCFMPDRHILDNAHKLAMPVWLVQGRYDMVCPPATAYELHQRLPKSELIWTIAGHRAEHESWNIMRNILLQLAG